MKYVQSILFAHNIIYRFHFEILNQGFMRYISSLPWQKEYLCLFVHTRYLEFYNATIICQTIYNYSDVKRSKIIMLN